MTHKKKGRKKECVTRKGKIYENNFVTVYTTRLKFGHTFSFKYIK